MENDLESAAGRLLSSADGKRIAAKRGELEDLAASEDGRAVADALNGRGLENALRTGDMEAVRSALTGALQSDAGARLAEKLRGILGK